MNTTEFAIKRGFTDSKPRKLSISKDVLVFESGDHVNNEFTILRSDEIVEYRFGIRWIRFELTYGREYQIFIRDKHGTTIKISFKSYFKRRLKRLHRQYADIISALNRHYFDGIVDEMVDKVMAGEIVQIGDVILDPLSVSFSVSGVASQKRVEVNWENVGTKVYYRYFSIFDKTDAINKNRGYNFHEDWNAAVLVDVIQAVLERKTSV